MSWASREYGFSELDPPDHKQASGELASKRAGKEPTMSILTSPDQGQLAQFDALWPDAQQYVTERANELNDGTRTAARCWSMAISEVDVSADPREA